MLGGQALGLADVSDLIVLGRARVQGPAQEELGHHTAQAPHVDGLTEREAEDDLRGSVVARLEVRVADGLAHVAGRPEVDHLDSVRLPHGVHQHDVLWLQVGVDQTELLQFQQSGENLTNKTIKSPQYKQTGGAYLVSDRPDVLKRKGLELVLFEEVVQILLQHLEYEAGVVLVCEALVGSDKIVFVRIFLTENS